MGIPLNNNNRRSPTNTERVSGVEKTESAKQQTIIIAMAVVLLVGILASTLSSLWSNLSRSSNSSTQNFATEGDAGRLYLVRGTPTTFFVNSQGVIEDIQVGFITQ
jgi:hypothetical protein